MTTSSWIALHPSWFVDEIKRLRREYPDFRVDAARLKVGELVLYGELLVRVKAGTQRHPVALEYPDATPFEKPAVIPLESMPKWGDDDTVSAVPSVQFFDRRHQMPGGALCLFQRETRAAPAGDIITGVDTLRRATRWFVGLHTGHWPPDSAESELEAHFLYAGDVLLGEALYADRLEGDHGRFFFTRDYRRLFDAPDGSAATCPMIITSLTLEGSGIIQPIDTRGELERLYPWIRGEAWGTTEAIASETRGATPFDPVDQGWWWSLPAEPLPFTDGRGLLSVLARAIPSGDVWDTVRDALGSRLTTEPLQYIALRYPGRHGTPEWLIIVVATRMNERQAGAVILVPDPEKRSRFEASPVWCIRAHSIRRTDLHLRNTGVIASSVADKRVALIGLGALGSEIAELLAKAGVGGFRLCDSDRLAIGNVARHVGGVPEFGAPKVRVVRNRLMQINPHLNFLEEDLQPWSATMNPDRLASMLADVDLVVATTADEGIESFINQQAALLGKPVIYGRALRHGDVGRIFLVRPGHDACKTCLALHAANGRAGKSVPEGWIDVPEAADVALLHECGRPVIPGSGIDLAFIAALAARVALTVLEGGDGDENHWIWTKEPAPDLDPRLDRPLSSLATALAPRPDCPICAQPEIERLVIGKGLADQIAAMVESSPTAETGGILIGYVENRQAVVLRATGPGPKAERSADIFRRDVAHVQAELDRAVEELGEWGQYLGEWHSHLVADPSPSPTDIGSLVGISGAPHYLTRCPVMIIVGFDKVEGRCARLLAWTFPIERGIYDLPIEIEETSPDTTGITTREE